MYLSTARVTEASYVSFKQQPYSPIVYLSTNRVIEAFYKCSVQKTVLKLYGPPVYLSTTSVTEAFNFSFKQQIWAHVEYLCYNLQPEQLICISQQKSSSFRFKHQFDGPYMHLCTTKVAQDF